MLSLEKQFELIRRGAVEIIPEESLHAKLKESIESRKPLRVKAGFDPSAPDIHLGHTIPFRKLQNFIECGHQPVIIIGDYTAMIGDPSGKSKTRKQLSEEEVQKNAKTYINQMSKALDIKKAKIVYNSEWLGKMNLKDIIELTGRHTVARMLERDDFAERYKKGEDISMVEFIYPLLTAYDSVFLKADVEIGGTDQKFNMLLARAIQKRYGLDGEIVLTMPLLEGTDGTEKMSKSLGNYIGISEEPRNMFGKLMSIPDKLIIKYMELLTNIPAETIAGHKKGMEEGGNPKDFKTLLAKTIVSCYYDAKTADQEEKDFQLSFAQKDIQYDKHSYDVSDKYPAGSSVTALELTATAADFEKMNLSATEIKRRIADGAILINEKKITNFSEKIQIEDDIKMKLGKKNFCLLKVKK